MFGRGFESRRLHENYSQKLKTPANTEFAGVFFYTIYPKFAKFIVIRSRHSWRLLLNKKDASKMT